MLSGALNRMRNKIRTREYIVTLHARQEMKKDGLGIYDVECAILTGSILERQRDEALAEWKYRVRGATLQGAEAEVIGKFTPTGKLVIITVYICWEED
jgi:hypothetical protein